MSSNNFPETNAFLLILDSKCTPYSDNAQQLEELADFARQRCLAFLKTKGLIP